MSFCLSFEELLKFQKILPRLQLLPLQASNYSQLPSPRSHQVYELFISSFYTLGEHQRSALASEKGK